MSACVQPLVLHVLQLNSTGNFIKLCSWPMLAGPAYVRMYVCMYALIDCSLIIYNYNFSH